MKSAFNSTLITADQSKEQTMMLRHSRSRCQTKKWGRAERKIQEDGGTEGAGARRRSGEEPKEKFKRMEAQKEQVPDEEVGKSRKKKFKRMEAQKEQVPDEEVGKSRKKNSRGWRHRRSRCQTKKWGRAERKIQEDGGTEGAGARRRSGEEPKEKFKRMEAQKEQVPDEEVGKSRQKNSRGWRHRRSRCQTKKWGRAERKIQEDGGTEGAGARRRSGEEPKEKFKRMEGG